MANRKARHLAFELKISERLADDLLVLAGGDPDLVLAASAATTGLDQCKQKIIASQINELGRRIDDVESRIEAIEEKGE